MPNVHVLFWFDVEDCTVPQSDDANKRLARILEQHGARGTFKVVGQKARLFEQRLRYDVTDALRAHDIGYHSNLHGWRPQIAEYLADLDPVAGAAEFARREGPGLDDVRRVFAGQPITTYGQPGPNWAPQVFGPLRDWGIPTYVSGFGYVGVDCQPFWYQGLLCTSHMYGRRLNGAAENHLKGLNFELGRPGELAGHQSAFQQSLDQLSSTGGLISILNHPCTLVLEEWFSTNLKSRELTEAGYQHFADYVEWALSKPGVRPTCAGELLQLYPDQAVGHCFSPEELGELAAALTDEVSFVRLGDRVVSAAEALALLADALTTWRPAERQPEPVRWQPVYGPEHAPPDSREATLSWAEFAAALVAVRRALEQHGQVPGAVPAAGGPLAPADVLAAAARVLQARLAGGALPDEVLVRPVVRRFEDHVDADAAEAGWRSVMMPPGFAAPNLLTQARLGAWTVKPAVLVA